MACLFFVNIQIDDDLGYCSVEQCFLEKEPSYADFPEIRVKCNVSYIKKKTFLKCAKLWGKQ